MEYDHIPIAVRNWLALRPEERWWLFGMTAMTTGGINDGNKGWQHALGDVAQHELFKPLAQKSKTLSSEKDLSPSTFSLFDLE